MNAQNISTRPPLTPADCDLSDFAFMPLDVARLRDSELAANESPEACWAAVLLWAASWHQIPAASIPNDEKWIAKQAGYAQRGRIAEEWSEVRDGALRGWIECDDGRLYHPVVAEKARDAWQAKLRQRWATECARIKKHNDRHHTDLARPSFEQWVSLGCPQGHALPVPGDSAGTAADVPGTSPPCPSAVAQDTPRCPAAVPDLSPNRHVDVPRETHSKREGEGQREGQRKEEIKKETRASEANASGGKPPRATHPASALHEPPDSGDPPDAADAAEAIFALGLPLLLAASVPDKNARSFLGFLRKSARKQGGDAAVLSAIERCVQEKSLQPVEFLQGCLKASAKVLPFGASRAASRPTSPIPAGKHAGFESKNYREGVTADGSLA